MGKSPNTLDEMVDVIQLLVRDEAERARLGGRGRTYVGENYSGVSVVKRYVELLNGRNC